MRTDENLDEEILKSRDWSDERPDQHLTYNVFETIEEDGRKRQIMHSLSGWERNKVFINRSGKFADVSLISGMDSDSDSRAHCSLDIEHDGFTDVALVNGNNPHLQLFSNRLGSLLPDHNNFIALKLIGGNTIDRPSADWSSRDAVGTLVEIQTDSISYVRELRFGEGFAAQDSKTMMLGTGTDRSANLRIRWLSGNTQEFEGIETGKLISIFENPEQSNDGSGADIAEYRRAFGEKTRSPADDSLRRLEFGQELDGASYHLVTSFATWCPACKKMAPQIKLLSNAFGKRLGLIGLPIDPKESNDDLKSYQESQQPAYSIHYETTDKLRADFGEIVAAEQGKLSLPGSVLVDSNGNVIRSWLGVPDFSEVAVLLDQSRSR